MQHRCPHPVCGRPMTVRGRPPKRHASADGTYIFCPVCGRIAQVLGYSPIIYMGVRSVGPCPRCRLPVPRPTPGAYPRCVVCRLGLESALVAGRGN